LTKAQVRYVDTIFLEEADAFLASLEKKAAEKVIYNIDLAEQSNDPTLFKKLQGEIWEFRTKHRRKELRLLAFGTRLVNSGRL